jgi:hypothetical protein
LIPLADPLFFLISGRLAEPYSSKPPFALSSVEEAQTILAALVVMAGERNGNAAFALAD